MALNLMEGALIRERKGDLRPTDGKTCKDGGREGGDVLVNHTMPSTAESPQKLGERPGQILPENLLKNLAHLILCFQNLDFRS